jgi:hypothetical protein
MSHRYHAKVTALEGAIESPIDHIIPVQIPLVVEETGGYVSLRAHDFRFEEIVSFKMAHTQVSGAPSKKPQKRGAPTTLASVVVEGLKVRDVLLCDRLVGQISSEHVVDAGTGKVSYDKPVKVSFLGTHFENLRISGKPVKIDLDLDLCEFDDSGTSCVDNPKFQAKLKNLPHKLDQNGKDPFVTCSLVTNIDGERRNFLDLPGFGKVFFAELRVDKGTYTLTMIRLELGCAVQANMSAGKTVVNGDGSGG